MTDLAPLVLPSGARLATWGHAHAPCGAVLPSLWVPGAEALALWRCLRAEAPRLGAWPVLAWTPPVRRRGRPGRAEEARARETTAALLAEAAALNPLAWLAARGAARPSSRVPPRGSWPAGARPLQEPTVHLDRRGGPRARIPLVFAPAAASWQVPAVLAFGAGGGPLCPGPAEHTALLRHWHTLYGAEVLSMAGLALEVWVATPPATARASLVLALEHDLYCPALLDHGRRSLDSLAARLQGAAIWSFRWA